MLERYRDILAWILHLLTGTVLCMIAPLSVLVLGWGQRYIRYRVYLYWFHGSKKYQDIKNIKTIDKQLNPYLMNSFPCLIYSTQTSSGFAKYLSTIKDNIVSGLLVLLNTFIFTLPFGLIWLFMWWAGWEISFNKSYEESQIVPVVYIISISFFSIVMTYLPMAQARQAVTESWKSFYDFKFIHVIIKFSGLKLVFLSFLYLLGAVGIMFFIKLFPLFQEDVFNIDATTDPEGFRSIIEFYYTVVALVFFLYFRVLKMVSAIIYASSVLRAIDAVAISKEDLTDFENKYLDSILGYVIHSNKQKSKNKENIIHSTKEKYPVFISFVQAILWSGVAITVYIGQFFNYDWFFWINQPLIHLPFLSNPIF